MSFLLYQKFNISINFLKINNLKIIKLDLVFIFIFSFSRFFNWNKFYFPINLLLYLPLNKKNFVCGVKKQIKTFYYSIILLKIVYLIQNIMFRFLFIRAF
jgi:hypothetical protein